MSIDIDKLEALARAATPGPWATEVLGLADEKWPTAMAIAATVGRQKIYARGGSNYPHADQQYIAAASPDVMLALIAALRSQERSANRDRPAVDDAAMQCPGCGANQTDPRGACSWCGVLYRGPMLAGTPLHERAAVVAFIRALVIKERRGDGLIRGSANFPSDLRSYAARVLALLADSIENGAHAADEDATAPPRSPA